MLVVRLEIGHSASVQSQCACNRGSLAEVDGEEVGTGHRTKRVLCVLWASLRQFSVCAVRPNPPGLALVRFGAVQLPVWVLEALFLIHDEELCLCRSQPPPSFKFEFEFDFLAVE